VRRPAEGGAARLALLDVGSGASPTLLRALVPLAREAVGEVDGGGGAHQVIVTAGFA